MDRTTRLTPNDAGYVVAHANEDGAHVDTAITPERAREDHR